MILNEETLKIKGIDVDAIKKAIIKFQKRNKINSANLPSIELGWKLKSGSKHLTINPVNNNGKTISVNANSKLRWIYPRYDDELDIGELSIISIDTSRTAPMNREFYVVSGPKYQFGGHKYNNIYIINKERAVYEMFYGELYKYTGYEAKRRIEELNNEGTTTLYPDLRDFAIKIIGAEFRYGGVHLYDTHYWSLVEWVKQSVKNVSNNDIFNNISEWKPSKEYIDQYKIFNRFYTEDSLLYSRPEAISKIESNDLYDIIRSANTKSGEYLRIFIDKNQKRNKIEIYVKEGDKWQKINRLTHTYHTNVIINPEDFNNTHRLKYIKELIYEESGTSYRNIKKFIKEDNYNNTPVHLNYIVSIIRHPIIEQLYKAGYKYIAQCVDADRINGDLIEYFGYNPKNKGDIYNQFSCNKYQLTFLNNKIKQDLEQGRYSPDRNIVKLLLKIKRVFKITNMQCLDDSTFDILALFVLNTSVIRSMHFNDTIYSNYYCYDYFDLFGMGSSEARIRFARKMSRMENTALAYQLLSDTFSVKHSCIRNNVTLINTPLDDIHNYTDIVHVHNYITDSYNNHMAEQRRLYNMEENKRIEEIKKRIEEMKKKYEKILKERQEKYEFSNDEYILKIPTNPQQELKDEGMRLSHCVGGYVDRQLRGDTNIIFLRKKDNPDVSFVTIEVQNNDEVTQIFGFEDAWIASTDEYQKTIPFLMQWMYQKKLKTEQIRLTSKSKGYCCRKEDGVIELPKVDFDVNEILL